jgi:hypothetical protein
LHGRHGHTARRHRPGRTFTHLAFYAGWPNAMTAVTRLKAIAENSDPIPTGK